MSWRAALKRLPLWLLIWLSVAGIVGYYLAHSETVDESLHAGQEIHSENKLKGFVNRLSKEVQFSFFFLGHLLEPPTFRSHWETSYP